MLHASRTAPVPLLHVRHYKRIPRATATKPRLPGRVKGRPVPSSVAERFAEWALDNQTEDYIPRMTRQNVEIMYEQMVENASGKAGNIEDLIKTLREMRVGGFAPTKSSVSVIIKSLLRADETAPLWEFLEYLYELGWKINTRDAENIIRMIWKQDSVVHIADLHERLVRRKAMTKPLADVSLAINVRLGDFVAAEKTLLKMKMEKIRSDSITYMALTGMRFDPKKPGSPKATLTALLSSVRGKQRKLTSNILHNNEFDASTPSMQQFRSIPTDKDRRVLRNVLRSLTTSQAEPDVDVDDASEEYSIILKSWQQRNLPAIKKILHLSSQSPLKFADDDDEHEPEDDEFEREEYAFLHGGSTFNTELDGLLTLSFIAPRFWAPGTSAAVRASTIRRTLGIADVDYNRLEWLGDSVLELLVRDHLIKLRPSSDEGDLTQITSAIVSTQGCDAILRCLKLDRYILYGGSTLKDPEAEKINADVFEALLGALMMATGFAATQRVFQKALLPAIKLEADKMLTEFPVRQRNKSKR